MQMSIYDFALKGKHNQYNTMAAGLAASIIGIQEIENPGSGSDI